MFAILETAGAGTSDTQTEINQTICKRLHCTPRQLEAILWVREQMKTGKIKTHFNILGIYSRPGLYMRSFFSYKTSLLGGGQCFCICGYAASYLSAKDGTSWKDEKRELDYTNFYALFRTYNVYTGYLSIKQAIKNIDLIIAKGPSALRPNLLMY